ncbi:DUF6252 family protein [Nonlabens ponticola]|uniref:Uncharacterized protein n=1 Tax=Nonlabens ponticola TaxID=2496866 RepID=A0A3S9MW61_9FLAO|nr:DUF6252 family protein [Nonlabens ponticola]AZQ43420.1 hypothetical protein EJ995_03910 [Nonlabens ponticola]
MTFKKVLLIMLATIAFYSCEDNLDVDNKPAIQALRNNEFFDAREMSATTNSDGTVTIVGQSVQDRLEINISSSNPSIYVLGQGSPNEAKYTVNNSIVFSTRTGDSNGVVEVEPSLEDGTISGTFNFISFLPNATDTLVMRRGVFYQVPFGSQVGSSVVNNLSARIAGENFRPTSVNPQNNNDLVTVTATGSTRQVVLSFPDNIAVGSYDINGDGDIAAALVVDGNQNAAVSGRLEVTSVNRVNGQVSGTFEFLTEPPTSINVTNGTFTVTL